MVGGENEVPVKNEERPKQEELENRGATNVLLESQSGTRIAGMAPGEPGNKILFEESGQEDTEQICEASAAA